MAAVPRGRPVAVFIAPLTKGADNTGGLRVVIKVGSRAVATRAFLALNQRKAEIFSWGRI